MNGDVVPLWLAIAVVVFLIWGSGLTLLGCIGLARFSSFYDRLHMPALATSWGVGGVLIASMLYSSFHDGRPVFHEILITVFLVITTPITMMMVSRAAVHRDNTNDWSKVSRGLLPEEPAQDTEEEAEPPVKVAKKRRRRKSGQ